VPPLVNRGWARSLGVALRPEVLGAAGEHQRLTLRERQQQLLAAPQILGSVRPGAHLAGALGFDLAHPFFDRRLVELCLALPPDLSFRDGWTRYVLRQSMSGRLPDAVAWRIGKAKMTPAVERAVREFDEPRLRAVAQDPGWLADVLDMDAFRRFAAPDRPLTELEMTHLAWISTAVVWLNRQWPCGPASPSIYHHSSG
jgi:asparagine synthase (glutamine-hydrolysing)